MKLKVIIGLVLFVNVFSESYEEWLVKQNTEIKNYVENENDALRSFAEQEWKEYKSFVETPSPKKPGPKKIPKAPKWVWGAVLSSKFIQSSSAKVSRQVVLKSSQAKSSLLNVSSSSMKAVKPKSSSVAKVNVKKPSFDFDYYGVTLGFDLEPDAKAPTQSSEKAIKRWIAQTSKWSNQSRESFAKLCKQHNITGWAQLQLANAVATKIHGSDESSVSALSWWLLGEDKVDVRLAYLGGKVVLLYHTTAKVFGVSYLRLDSKPYYLFDPQGKKGEKTSLDGIRTWPQSFGGRVEVDLTNTSLSLSKIENYKELVYRLGDKLDTLKLPRNSVQEKLWATYPLVEIFVPFNHRLAKEHHSPLIKLLKEKVNGMSEKDAIRFLLNLVQKSFKYETDDEQFGYENYFFPEEILGFRASDCEDRAVFFSYLVKNVVGAPVVLLDYPNHIATAVSLTAKHKGAQFLHKGKLFYVADPTYLGADIGMEMKGLDISKRLVID